MPLKLVTKAEWGAIQSKEVERLDNPVSYVVLKYHSRVPRCRQPVECRQYLRNLQKYWVHILNVPDVDYNFYIGDDGQAYEGRGWEALPAKDEGDQYHGQALDICYLGMFDTAESPSEGMVQTMQELVEFGIQNGHIKEDYTLIDR